MGSRETFFIGELAERSGTSRDTIRYYEGEGVLPEPRRSESGYRVYDNDAVERLRFVDQAKTLGLTLDQIADVLAMVDEEREPCSHVRRALEERLVETRQRIRELTEMETRLAQALSRAGEEEGAAESDCRCRIIEQGRSGMQRPGTDAEPTLVRRVVPFPVRG